MNAKNLIKILKKQKNSIVCVEDRNHTEITVRFQQSNTGEWYIVIGGEEPKNNQSPIDKKVE